MQEKLLQEAFKIVGKIRLNGFHDNSAGAVAAALITKDGNIYTGICLSLVCGLGFCAEASAIAEMLKKHETEIDMIVAVTDDGKIIPPCGRCRELLVQINKNNVQTKVIVARNEIRPLAELLPDLWAEKY